MWHMKGQGHKMTERSHYNRAIGEFPERELYCREGLQSLLQMLKGKLLGIFWAISIGPMCG